MSWIKEATGNHPFDDFAPASATIPDLKPIASRVLDAVSALLRDKRPGVVRLVGAPGTGKTMIVRRVARACRLADYATRREAHAITRVAGMDYAWDVPVHGENPRAFPPRGACWVPFRAPHHTTSSMGMTGDGPRPGELHLAHGGILFLDETPEFSRSVQEHVIAALHCDSPMIRTARSAGCVEGWRYPARFVCVTAENPCPCGYARSAQRRCSCSPSTVAAYQARNLIAQAFPDAPTFDLDQVYRDAGAAVESSP